MANKDCKEVIQGIIEEMKELGMNWEDMRTYRPRPYSRLAALAYGYDSPSLADYCQGKEGTEIEVQKYARKIGACGKEKVRIYRGGKQSEIQPGDWVAIDRHVAEYYVTDNPGSVLMSSEAKPEDVRWAGTDVSEWYYLPMSLKGCVTYQKLEEIKKMFPERRHEEPKV